MNPHPVLANHFQQLACRFSQRAGVSAQRSENAPCSRKRVFRARPANAKHRQQEWTTRKTDGAKSGQRTV